MNTSFLSNEIQKTLQSADRPEFTLMQRFETSGTDQKIAFVLAMIGKLIEQDRMLRSRVGGRHG
jgi:hypothetical protein